MEVRMPGFRVTFILPNNCKDESEASEFMLLAYENSEYLVSEVRWAREKELKIKELTKKDYLIFDDLATGRSFEKYEKSKCIILGPLALNVCFTENKPIPNLSWPIHNVAFYDCVITCSHISKPAKAEIKRKVQLMGGRYADGLTDATTHLVSDVVTTDKYITAAEAGKKIMLPSWVDRVWKVSQQTNVHASDEKFMKHRCLPFYNLVISSTGIYDKECVRLMEAVTDNGGQLSSSLKLTTTNILVCRGVPGTSSEKYKAARKSSIPCVTQEWIYDSIEKGYALPVVQYRVKTETSTPVKDGENLHLDFSTISAIGGSTLAEKTTINETANLTSLMVSTNGIGKKVTPVSVNKSKKRKAEYRELLEGIDFKKIKQSGNFLEHCCICVVGFDEDDREKLNKAISLSGATRYNTICDSVTHVIVGDASCAEAKQVLSKNCQCYVVSIQWFFDSMVQQQPVKEDQYLVKGAEALELSDGMGSPLSKKGLSLLKTNRTIIQEVRQQTDGNQEAESTSQNFMRYSDMPGPDTLAALLDNESGFTNQDLEITPNENTTLTMRKHTANNDCTVTTEVTNDDQTKSATDNHVSKAKATLSPQPGEQESQTQDSCTVTQEESEELTNSKIFQGLKFSLLNFTSELYSEVKGLIQDNGGTVVSWTFKGIPDYAVVTTFLISQINQTAQETVNELWLRDCIASDSLVDIEYFHRPFVVKQTQPLSECVVTISGYSSTERLFLKELVVELGGLDQDSFSRVTKEDKGIVACTHLVSLEANGKKFEAARKWNIPVVTKDWLLECTRTGECLPEEHFFIRGGRADQEDSSYVTLPAQKSVAIGKGHHMPAKQTTGSTKVLTPVNRKLEFHEDTTEHQEDSSNVTLQTLKSVARGKGHHTSAKQTTGSTKVLNPVNRRFKFHEDTTKHQEDLSNGTLPIQKSVAIGKGHHMSAKQTTGSTKVLTPVNRKLEFHEDTTEHQEDSSNVTLPTLKSVAKVKGHHTPAKQTTGSTKVLTPVNRRFKFHEDTTEHQEDLSNGTLPIQKSVAKVKGHHTPAKQTTGSTKVLTPVNRKLEVHEGTTVNRVADWGEFGNNTTLLTPKKEETLAKETSESAKDTTPMSRRLPSNDSEEDQNTPERQVYKFLPKESPMGSSQITPVSTLLQEARDKKLLDPAAESPPQPWAHLFAWSMKTPETPYGACIRPNPSPEFRKKFLEFIHDLPDFYSPPPRQRRLSTPLSEVKRQFRRRLVEGCARSHAECLANIRKSKESESESDDSDDVFQNLDVDNDKETSSKQAVDNGVINNKLQELDEMLTAQGTSSSSRRASKAFHPQTKPETVTTLEGMSQVCTVGWDFREDEQHEMVNKQKPKVFMLSGVADEVRTAIESQVESLGATVSHAQNYNPDGTHLLCVKTTRNEKTLAFMAAGKWILHLSYVENSYRAGRFLDEEEFEFGNPKSATNIPTDNTDEETQKRNRNVQWWRQTITERGYGAFHHMRAIVVAVRRDPLVRVIEAGGGVVVNLSPPFDDTVHVTHCLIEPKALKDSDHNQYTPLAQQGVLVVSTTYINDILQRKEDSDTCDILPQYRSYYEKQ